MDIICICFLRIANTISMIPHFMYRVTEKYLYKSSGETEHTYTNTNLYTMHGHYSSCEALGAGF